MFASFEMGMLCMQLYFLNTKWKKNKFALLFVLHKLAV